MNTKLSEFMPAGKQGGTRLNGELPVWLLPPKKDMFWTVLWPPMVFSKLHRFVLLVSSAKVSKLKRMFLLNGNVSPGRFPGFARGGLFVRNNPTRSPL